MKQASKNFRPIPFQYHQEIELTIDTLTNLGVGLGRVDNWVVMVPFSLPGECVRARVFKNHANYSEADLVKVLTPSKDRVKAPCPLFGECGGCQYQHMGYEAQLLWKQKHVQEVLERIAGLSLVQVRPTIGSPKEYRYRSKLTPHFPKPSDETFPVGFLRQGSTSHILDVPQCPIATDKINKVLPKAREVVRANFKKYKRGGTLLLRDGNAQEQVVTDPNQTMSERIKDFVFQFKAGEFFQNNPYILPDFVDYIIGQAKAEGIDYLVDVYCGVGTFAIFGHKHFKECVGIEINSLAINQAHVNASINNAVNVSFLLGKAEALFTCVRAPSHQTTVLLDPPRKGCDEAFIAQLMDFRPKRIVYVSCGPDTQARDLKMMLRYPYSITAIQPFDLFPQTRHIENVVTLELKG